MLFSRDAVTKMLCGRKGHENWAKKNRPEPPNGEPLRQKLPRGKKNTGSKPIQADRMAVLHHP